MNESGSNDQDNENHMSQDDEYRSIQKARIMKASHMLQSKVGFGEVDKEAIERGEKVIEAIGEIDFAPLIGEYVSALGDAIQNWKSHKEDEDDHELHESITEPVMQLKGNAAMFNYELVGKLANIMLNFLEAIEKIDDEVIEILEAHEKTLQKIIQSNMRDDGGVDGQLLQDELREACKRYFAKHIGSDPLNFEAFLD